ncbi:class I SAM-dependent methyltransferase [Paenibacillaceae bacterium]|nr:class I SAM-dependent methyltransferase [Paenibacillaceae bacterium]
MALEHYYSKTPAAANDRRTFEAKLRGHSLKFITDAGVFAKSGVDYGSRVLIEALELPDNARVLDVGCGYGPIGITAARLAPAGKATLIDINERAVELARENAKMNGIGNIEIIQSDLFEAVQGRQFDVLITNPPIRAGKAVVHQIFEEGAALLKPGGTMWVVIQKKQGAPSAREKLEAVLGDVVEVTKDKGYRIFKATKSI